MAPRLQALGWTLLAAGLACGCVGQATSTDRAANPTVPREAVGANPNLAPPPAETIGGKGRSLDRVKK